jgi:hypothetical protein
VSTGNESLSAWPRSPTATSTTFAVTRAIDHITAFDEVTQWEIAASVERISKAYLDFFGLQIGQRCRRWISRFHHGQLCFSDSCSC